MFLSLPRRAARRTPSFAVLSLLLLPFWFGLAAPSHAATPGVHAIVGARVVVAPGQVLDTATVVVRDGLIVAVGRNAAVPPDARVWEGAGLTVYPGLIDAHVAAPEPAGARVATRGAAAELASVRPEFRVVSNLPLPKDQIETLRAAGFAAAQVVPSRGIVRGTSAVVGLADGSPNASVIKADATQVIALEPDSTVYPRSLMGAIAVIRQTLSDARWYREMQALYAKPVRRGAPPKPAPEANVSWAALDPVVSGAQGAFFEASDMLDVLRAATIAREAGVRALVLGAGDEYKRMKDIAATSMPLVIPVSFPEAPDVTDPDAALEVSTEELRYWDQAPANAAALERAGVRFALSATGLKDPKSFRGRVQKAIDRGLSADAALASVTTVPAEMLGLSDRLGTIAIGKVANLTVTRGDLFSRRGRVRSVWVEGVPYENTAEGRFTGDWLLTWGHGDFPLKVEVARDTSVRLVTGSDTLRAQNVRVESGSLSFLVRPASEPAEYFFLTTRDDGLEGSLTVGEHSHNVSGRRAPAAEIQDLVGRVPFSPVETPIVMGNTEPWRMPPPEQPPVLLVKDATVWTAGAEGVLENADVLIRAGKIAAVGKDLAAPANAVIIDGAGKHVAPGIIDCHSHSAIEGQVNECTNNVTAEVRIQDVVNSESIEIYRQLAGGTTIMHLLHGSCNAIGGQCAVIKNKWGESPDRLLFAAAPPTIKFALGENPKQSNFPGTPSTRYPQSRSGVEQLIRDSFTQARDYAAAIKEYKTGLRPYPPRRDLQKEAIVEILDGKRKIHSHSYRQDEILMLMRVAEEFGIRVNTFQHVLEGYKVADQMASHGASGSTFSDWWGYKYEVIDAIPYNGYLMWDRGVTVSYDSDSDELARRLNTEAAKAIKYGGVPREEAIKFVTINPAMQLHVEDRVGSLEIGKDADFSIWNGSPLSPYSHCEQTWIEGRKYFDRAEDLAGREALARERDALIERARGARRDGGGPVAASWTPRYLLDADRTGSSCGGESDDEASGAHDHSSEKETER
jgi:imidazolonepropionase-like amidohydrolase